MIREAIAQLTSGQSLSRERAREVFAAIVGGKATDIELAALLIALKCKGETPAEVAGAAQALRDAATPWASDERCTADCCGTGGDGAHTVNISTAVALLAAELGLKLVKHGNRAVSSACGSADVLEHAGVKIDPSPEVAARCLAEVGICFLFAPTYHAGMRHAMPVRKALGLRTIFNLLGPLANPAAPAVQLLGVYDPALCQPMAETLQQLGCARALVVHGSGLDEIAVHGPTIAVRLFDDGHTESLTITPEHVGFVRRPPSELAGGLPEENARWLTQLLSGQGAASHNEAVALNAGALLWISGAAESLAAGSARALQALLAGGALARLERLRERSHGA